MINMGEQTMKFLTTACLLLLLFFPLNAFGGCIQGDCTNGQGTYNFSNGDTYVGHFKNGKMDGKGSLSTHYGGKYVGEFKNNMLNGYVVSDRNIILRELQSNEFFITYTDIRFLDISESVSEILLILAGKEQGSRRICFQSINRPRQITLESLAVECEERANQFQIKLPEYKDRAILCIKF